MALEAGQFTGIIHFTPNEVGRIMMGGLAAWERSGDAWTKLGRIMFPDEQPNYTGSIALEDGEPDRILAGIRAEMRNEIRAKWAAMDNLRYGFSDENPYVDWD